MNRSLRVFRKRTLHSTQESQNQDNHARAGLLCADKRTRDFTLIQLDAETNSSDVNMSTSLHEAVAANGSVELVQSMLTSGADVNAKDYKSETPLHLAVSKNNVAIVQLLLQNGASINSENKCRQTPLHCVRWTTVEAAETVALLASNGADVNARDRASETPLHKAVSHDNVKIVRTLIEHGAAVDCQNKFQLTALHRALLTKNVAVEMVELLLTSGADANTTDYKVETPLHAAVSKNNLPVVRLLIEHGASVNREDKYRRTPLHRAVSNEATQMVALLVSKGADLNVEDRAGETPLHLAVFRNNATIVRLLLQHGASVDRENERRQTPLHCVQWAAREEAVKIADLSLSSGVHQANVKDPTRGADVNAKDREGNRPLHYISKHWILYSDCKSILDMLLGKGAFVNARNNRRESALYLALKCMNEAAVDELMKHGADLEDPDVRRLILSAPKVLVQLFSRLRLIAAKAANLPFGEYKAYIDVYGDKDDFDFEFDYIRTHWDDPRDECLEEIEKLKKTFICNHKSLYDFLHMRVTRRGAYTSSEKLQQLVEWSRLKEQFPLYSTIILASYREAVTRKSLSEGAQEALYAMTQVRLPDVIEQILDFLDDGDLINIIDANAQGDADDEE